MAAKSPLDYLLRKIVVTGDLTVSSQSGNVSHYGDGSGEPVAIRLQDNRIAYSLALNPQLKLGEAYMDGRLVVERGNIYDLIALLVKNVAASPRPLWLKALDKMRIWFRRWRQFNPAFRAKRNAAHHYDIDGRIYDLFLDPDRQYSCAYFETPDATLEEAQLAKKRHIAAKLLVPEGARVLDIGSGWGGLGLYLAQIASADVTGVTLSREQLDLSNKRAQRLGLQNRVRFLFQDYRYVKGLYDRIVSVGMFEHVGVAYYQAFFNKLHTLLKPDGVALLHTIGRAGEPGATNPFIAKYIFPGGYIPSLSEIMPAIEKARLVVTDIEILRLHYAETLRAWRERFRANWDKAVSIMGERFCRMWEFYLAGSEAAFRFEDMVVFQIQLARSKTALPQTRAYMAREEERLVRLEKGGGPQLAQEAV